MRQDKKKRTKRKIIFDYKSSNPFGIINESNRKEGNKILFSENEWLIEYESIYRSYQLDR